jgi:hypothetical protein
MSPNQGAFVSDWSVLSESRPPITTVSPSLTTTTFSTPAAGERGADVVDVADPGLERGVDLGDLLEDLRGAGLSPSVICGVTRSVTPMSWRSTLTDDAEDCRPAWW